MANIGYIRVSSADQNTDRQDEALKEVGISPKHLFTDKVSGKSLKRPSWEACRKHLRGGDVLHVYSIDRLCRNLLDLQNVVNDLVSDGVTVAFIKERLEFSGDDTNPMNKLTMQLMGAFAEFERSMIKSRQAEGIKAARAKGVKFGRESALSGEAQEEVRQKCSVVNHNKAEIAKEYGISRPTLYRILKSE